MFLEISGDTAENTGFPTARGTNVGAILLVIKASGNLRRLKDVRTLRQQIAGFQIVTFANYLVF